MRSYYSPATGPTTARRLAAEKPMQPLKHLHLALGILVLEFLATLQSASANTADYVISGSSNLTAAGSYSAGSPGTTSDVEFLSGTTYSPAAFTLNSNGFNLGIGTLDDLDTTQILTIQDTTGGDTSAITLNGGSNSLAPSASDLLYVASGGTLSIGTAGSGILNLALAASGNFDIAGTANIGSVISGAQSITLTGGGTLTLSGANTYSGGTTIQNGTLLIGVSNSTTVSGALGPSASAVTLGNSSGSNNASLLTSGAYTFSNNITVAVGSSGTLSMGGNSANTSTFSGVTTLDNNLTISQVAGGTVNLTGTITSGAAGTQTITFNNAGTVNQNTGVLGGGTGTINLIQSGTGTTTLQSTYVTSTSNANTFNGTIAVNAGALGENNSAGFGASTNTITLGNSAANASLIIGGASTTNAANLEQPITVSGAGTNTITGTWTNGGQINLLTGLITLNTENLTINSTNASGWRIEGGVTGTGNLTFQANGSGGISLFVKNATTSSQSTEINNAGTVTNAGTSSAGLYTNTGNGGVNQYFGPNVTSLIENSTTSGFYINNVNTGNFVGTAQVLSGTMALQNASALGSSNAVYVASGATLDVQNVSDTIAGLNNSSGSGGTVTDSTATGVNTLTLGGTGAYSFGGIITAATPADMALIKSGTGTQTLSGASTYTGGTTIQNGVLLIGISNAGTTSGALGPSTAAVTLGNSSGSNSASLLTNGGYTFSNAITVAAGSSGTLSIGGAVATSSTFSGIVTLDNNLTVSQLTGGTVGLTGNFTSGASGTQTLTFNNVGTVSQSTGVIGGGTGTIAVTQAGAGLTNLSGANTYSGLTTISAGTLQLGNSSALGSGTATLTGASGILDFDGNSIGNSLNVTANGATFTNSSATAVTSSGTLGINAVTLSSFTVSGVGNITFTGYMTGNNSSPATITVSGDNIVEFEPTGEGDADGFASITVTSGTAILGATGNFVGFRNATVNGGVLQLDPNHTTTSATENWAGQIQNHVTITSGTFDLNGTGGQNDTMPYILGTGGVLTNSSANIATLTLSQRANTGGPFTLASTISGAINLNVVSSVTGGNTEILTGNNVGWTGTATLNSTGSPNGLTVLGNQNAMENIAVVNSAVNELGFSNALSGGTNYTIGSLAGAGNLALSDTGGGAVALTVGGNGGSTTYSGNLSGLGSTLIKSGAGSLTLGGSNSFSGGLTISSGTVYQTNANGLGSGTVTLGSGSGSNPAALVGNLASTATNNNAITVAAGGTGTYTLDDAGSDLYLNGNIALNNALTLMAPGGSGALFIGGTITGASNITINDAGSASKFVVLSASNASTFTGNVLVINSGDLKIGNVYALGSSNSVTMDSTSKMDMGGLGLTIAGLNDVITGAGGSSVLDNGAGLVLAGTGSYSYSGNIGSSGALTESGPGTQVLSGSDSYTGSTIVSGGILKLANLYALSTSTVTVSGGGTLDLNGNAIANAFATGGLSGTLTNTGSAVNISATTISDNGNTFAVNGTGNITMGTIAGTSGLTLNKYGGNTLTLSGSADNTSLAVNVNSGTVILSKSVAGNAANTLTLAGGSAQLAGAAITGNHSQINNLVVNSGTFDLNGQNAIDSTIGTLAGTGGVITNNSSTSAAVLYVGAGGATVTGSTTFAGVIQDGSSNNVSVNFQGNGATSTRIITLSGNNTYSGATTIGAGTVIVTGSLSGTVSTTVTSGATLEVDGLVNTGAANTMNGPGATLQGTGMVGAITANGGAVSPGLTGADSVSSSGTLTAAGAVNLSSTTNFNIRVGVSSTTDSDQLAVTNGASVGLNGTLNIALGAGLGALTSSGNPYSLYYVILNGGTSTISGGFSNFTIGGNAANVTSLGNGISQLSENGYTFDISYDGTSSSLSGGDDVVLELTAVPEPETWAILLGGMGMLIAIQRARRRKL
jgi:autotransporter-associated beta strand protein